MLTPRRARTDQGRMQFHHSKSTQAFWRSLGHYTVAASLVLMAGAQLGTPWLSARFLGTPTGLWLALLGGGAYAWFARPRSQARTNERRDPLWRRLFDALGAATARELAAMKPESDPADEDAGHDLFPAGTIAGVIERLHTRLGCETPLRIGVRGLESPEWPDGLLPEQSVRVIDVPAGENGSEQEIIRSRQLDACIFVEPTTIDAGSAGATARRLQNVTIVTAGAPGKPGADIDFGAALPMHWDRVFTPAADSGRTLLRGVDTAQRGQLRALFGFTAALAALSRLPHRLTLSDPVIGRHPWSRDRASRLVGQLLRIHGSGPAHQASARLIASWFGLDGQAGPHGPWGEGVMEATMSLIEEPAALLQRGAALLACGDEDKALRAFVDAAMHFKAEQPTDGEQSARILQRELEAASEDDPNAMARIAAAVTITLCGADDAIRRYARQDVEDDLWSVGWIGGDPTRRQWFQRLLDRVTQLPSHMQLTHAA
jgi:hypothetical protein